MKSKRPGKCYMSVGLSKTLAAFAGLGPLVLVLYSLAIWQPRTSLTVEQPRTSQVVTPFWLSGTVVDDEGSVLGAVVRVKGNSTSTVTGPRGRFTLRVASDAQRITAWKDGYFIGGAAADSQPIQIRLEALPRQDNPDYVWVDPTPNPEREQNCGNCHEEIYQEWSVSNHASAASNRHFRNLLDGTDWDGRQQVGWNLMADNAFGAGVCTACHAPSIDVADAAFDDLRKAEAVSAMGVHCDFCHKVQAPAPVPLGVTHGRFGLKLLRPNKEQQLFFGPLDDVDRGEDVFSAFYSDSRYCASCHEGIMFGVHVYSTYSEWLESPASRAGKHCVSCHMRPTGEMQNIAPGHGGIIREASSLASHRFPGGTLKMLKDCLSVEARIEPATEGVHVSVQVQTQNVGHRVPTGFVDRHLILLVSATNAAGQPVNLTTGPTVPNIVGKDLSGHAGRLYAKQLTDFAGRQPVPFWRARPEFIDTRLFPNQTDRSKFLFPTTVRQVRIQLIYRRFWQQVANSKGWPDNQTTIYDQSFNAR